MNPLAALSAGSFTLCLAGCGLGVPQLAEVYDRGHPSASLNMQLQVKRAIYCEFRRAAISARGKTQLGHKSDGRYVTTVEDVGLPPTWGAQIELSFTVDEKSTLAPSVSFKTPLPDAPVNFPGQLIGATGLLDAVTYGPIKIGQSYSLGFGGVLSSQTTRIDKFDYYYSMKQLIDDDTGKSTCADKKQPFGPDSGSSPFLVRSNLGIEQWLPDAVVMNGVLRSSRASDTGIGKPLGEKADSFSYNIKFVIVSSGSINPTWNLVRIGTNSDPLLDMARTRTHELLITIGPGAKSDFRPLIAGKLPRFYILPAGPSQASAQAHLASQIGNAVARSLRAE